MEGRKPCAVTATEGTWKSDQKALTGLFAMRKEAVTEKASSAEAAISTISGRSALPKESPWR